MRCRASGRGLTSRSARSPGRWSPSCVTGDELRSDAMSSWERGAMVLTPLVAVATLAAGLRMGASPAVRSAVVYGAPPAAGHAGLAWQVVTLLEDRGVREATALARVSVVARARGLESRWEGSTNEDGVAEVWLDLPGVSAGDPMQLQVRAPDEALPLAEGRVSWPVVAVREGPAGPAFVRPSKQDGDLVIDVAVYGSRIAPGFTSNLWIRVTDRSTKEAVAGAVVDADPEPGLNVPATRVTSNAAGYADLAVVAQIHVGALALHAVSTGGASQREGAWYGAIPVAPGASFVSMPLTIPPGEPQEFDVVVPTVVQRIYAEVDDRAGRAFATSLAVAHSHATIAVPALPLGTYWLVTSGEPRGAESLDGAALALPFLVAEEAALHRESIGPVLALLSPPRFSRFVALDGLPGKRRAEGSRRRRGFAIALGALGLAAAIETLLILRAVARSKRLLARVSDALDGEGVAIERSYGAVSVGIGLLLALLGFALLAALLTWRAG